MTQDTSDGPAGAGSCHRGKTHGRCLETLAACQHYDANESEADADQLQAAWDHPPEQINESDQQRNDGNENNDEAGTDGLLGDCHAAHAAAEHEPAHDQRVVPLARLRPGCLADPAHPGGQARARHQETRTHLQVWRKAHQRKLDGEVGRAPDEPGRGEAGHHDRRQPMGRSAREIAHRSHLGTPQLVSRKTTQPRRKCVESECASDEIVWAELHWRGAREIGRREFKIRRLLCGDTHHER
ncbi:MAG TPA: hypothetical protein VK676_05795 [Steroidobacteraceae bacterium]|nr:hypothetical protein [Steroidobacteraceae bacterium]